MEVLQLNTSTVPLTGGVVSTKMIFVSVETLPERRLATSASSGRNVDRLSRRLVFSVNRDDGASLVPQRSLVQQKDIAVDDDNLLASEEERSGVLRELEQALFDQLIRQLARI